MTSLSEFDSLQDNTCSVHALYSYILPPNSEKIICGKLNAPFPQGSIGIVDPRAELSTHYHVCGAAELVSTSISGMVPIQLLNPTNQAVRIFRHSSLRTFSPTGEDLSAISLSDPPSPDLETTSEAPLPQNPHIPFELSDTTLSPVEQEKPQALLLQYQDIFAPSGSQLGRTNIVQHTIHTGEAPPIRLRPYCTSPTQREEIDKQITDMLSQNIIQESVSPWSAPVVLVKKKDDTTRFFVLVPFATN